MNLKEQLANDFKEAMRNKNQLQKDVITMIRSDIKQAEVDQRVELNDDQIIEILSRQTKQRKDAIEEFRKGSRDDLIAQTEQEIEILKKYLPEALTEDEITKIVKDIIKEINASSIKDMGKVMTNIIPKVKGRADGKIVNQIVKECLN